MYELDTINHIFAFDSFDILHQGLPFRMILVLATNWKTPRLILTMFQKTTITRATTTFNIISSFPNVKRNKRKTEKWIHLLTNRKAKSHMSISKEERCYSV